MRFAQAYDPDAVGAAREDHDVEPHTDEPERHLAQFATDRMAVGPGAARSSATRRSWVARVLSEEK
jgi:hypothetical protein